MNADRPVLRDIHLPADPAWWPPAPGWWLLLAIFVLLLVAIVIRIGRRWQLRRWRQGVMNELELIALRHRQAPDDGRLLAEISHLLRRASRLVNPAAVSLYGEDWLRFLDSVSGDVQFSSGVGRALLEGPYRRQIEIDADAMLGLTRTWLRKLLTRKAMHA
jgi:hypothetical protein